MTPRRPPIDIDLLFPTTPTPGWQDEAACAGLAPETWFPTLGHIDEYALRICATCPVARDCLETAMTLEDGATRNYRTGIWGGYTVQDRVRLERARTKARRDAEEAVA